MKKSVFLFNTLLAVCGMALPITSSQLLAASSGAGNNDVTDRLPIDLARGSLGAHLQVRTPKDAQSAATLDSSNHSAQALISDDASLSYPLAQGTTSMILSLRKIDVLSRLNFIDYGAEGVLTISASSTKLPFDSADWHPVASNQKFGGDAVVGCDLRSLEARYLKLDFQTQAPGRISGLGVFGLLTINSLDPHPASVYTFTANSGANTPSSRQGGDVYFDCANLNTGAKVVSVSRGGNVSRAQAMLDGNVETNYSFDPTDPSPTVVVDLSARRAVSRLSCVYQAPAGRFDFYLVDDPYTSEYQRSATLSYISSPSTEPADSGAADHRRASLAHHKAICSVSTTGQGGISRASADVSGASGRFLVAEFHPIATRSSHSDPKDFKDAPDFKDFKDTGAAPADGTEGQPLRLISLSAFGDDLSSDTISRIPNVPFSPVQPGNGGGTTVPPINPNPGGTIVVAPPVVTP